MSGEAILPANRDSGFALLEAVVALIASALVLALFLQVVSRNSDVRHATQDRLTPILLAQSKFASVDHLEAVTVGLFSGVLADKYHWTFAIEEVKEFTYPRTDTPLKPFRLTVDITWQDGIRSERVRYRTIRLAQRS